MRRTVRLDEDPWRIIYETATYCGLELGKVVSLTQALKVVLFLLKDQGWFKANREAILAKAGELSKEGIDEKDSSMVPKPDADVRADPGNERSGSP